MQAGAAGEILVMSYSQEDQEPKKLTRTGSREVWMRGLAMLVVLFLLGIGQSVLFAIALVQFAWMVIAGERNMVIADFGRSLGLWQAECTWFLSGDTQERPFPWRPWPKG
jgi:hypothetical protein